MLSEGEINKTEQCVLLEVVFVLREKALEEAMNHFLWP